MIDYRENEEQKWYKLEINEYSHLKVFYCNYNIFIIIIKIISLKRIIFTIIHIFWVNNSIQNLINFYLGDKKLEWSS